MWSQKFEASARLFSSLDHVVIRLEIEPSTSSGGTGDQSCLVRARNDFAPLRFVRRRAGLLHAGSV